MLKLRNQYFILTSQIERPKKEHKNYVDQCYVYTAQYIVSLLNVIKKRFDALCTLCINGL
jgi:hypothetical protein